MKVSVVVLSAALVFASMASAAQPRGGYQRFRSVSLRQVEAAPQEPPYPPSGWKPDKPFNLPGEEVTTEADAEVFTTTTEAPAETTTTAAEETEPEAELSIPAGARNRLVAAKLSEPAYYVLLPQQPSQQVPHRSAYQFLIPDNSVPDKNAYILRDVEAFGAPLYFYGERGLLVQIPDRKK
ncbi:uncharacterized protein LOC124155015 [Ischnura elegans]|uniref:uncharacterized protein LOC124155015 n=1 Tax=Ischnura elegans TaxID=197161 RepID=UPI001ED891B6|nr:uncharacterized protein LOC124155015 [Ischnura elegans]